MKHKIFSFVLLLAFFSFGIVSVGHALLERTSSGYIPNSFYDRFHRLEMYSPNLRQWGPRTENYFVQLGPARPLQWGPWYARMRQPLFVQQKTKHIDLQKPKGRVILPMMEWNMYDSNAQDFMQEQYSPVE